jgi:hypothetical protein
MSKRIFYWFCILIISVTLNACQASPTVEPTTPAPVHVGLSALLRPWTRKIKSCASANPELTVIIDETDNDIADLGLYAFDIRLADPVRVPPFITQMGTEELALITSPEVPVSEMTSADVQSIYSGKIKKWTALSGVGENNSLPKIELWQYPDGNTVKKMFESSVLTGKSRAVLANLAPNPAQMITAISSTPGAVGYVPSGWVDSTVRQVKIADPSYNATKFPVLAIANIQPTGDAAELLRCLIKLNGKS